MGVTNDGCNKGNVWIALQTLYSKVTSAEKIAFRVETIAHR